MKYLLTFRLVGNQRRSICKQFCCAYSSRIHHQTLPADHCTKYSSKNVRKQFLDYFVNEKNHTYVPSSPVFLNNDPTLLFVNAGMNQFRSLIANKLPPGHRFHRLQRAANSQKCIRLSGKHNDLDDVGKDLHHHTFFEMLGNWSFGDYSKKEACEMAWELLTGVFKLNPENLYVTYFGGCKALNVPADEECLNIWLKIGVPENHIFPFGAKDNFWEMADVGPCGPCTEIHYDFLGHGPESAAMRINADKPDLIEMWNLVFIQFNREPSGILSNLPSLSVDTGMGFERLCAILQGTMSNYDTDIFVPIFKAIEKTFNVPPYGGETGSDDVKGLDSAYRTIADHSRMFSVAIADGLFPDSYDAGHVLRKIIRRASYAANKVMKAHPGLLSSLVPVVADSLDFFPEVGKSVDEIIGTVNEEERLFHHLINKGRKARNKMIVGAESNVLSGAQIWKLKENHGLDEHVIRDLASEIHLDLDWTGYETVCREKKEMENKKFQDKLSVFSSIVKSLQDNSVLPTNDSFKYNYSTHESNYGVDDIKASVVGVIINNQPVHEASSGQKCLLVTDQSNFYSEAGGQVSDVGKIENERFTFDVSNVISSNGYLFHCGTVLEGTVQTKDIAQLHIQKDHRLGCSQNHTATHLLNYALRSVLPNTSQRSSLVGPHSLKFGYSAKAPLTLSQIEIIEDCINEIIKKKMDVNVSEVRFEELMHDSKAVIIHGEIYPEIVKVVMVADKETNQTISMEPCCGTHVRNTGDILKFIIIPSKSHGGSTRYLSAVTGKEAYVVEKMSQQMLKEVLLLQKKLSDAPMMAEENLSSLLKEVKQALKNCQQSHNASLVTREKCEKILHEMKLKLTDLLASFTANENDMPLQIAGLDDSSKTEAFSRLAQKLLEQSISATDDSFKYNWTVEGSCPIQSKIVALVEQDNFVESVMQGFNCQIILDKTNFYSEDDDQASDTGIISCKDFVFKVTNVFKVDGYVFHDGYVEDGCARKNSSVKSEINQENRLVCSQNHSALHVLNAVLRKELPYAYQLSAYAGPKELSLTFSSKSSLTESDIEVIEKKINEVIKMNLPVTKKTVPKESLKDFPTYKLPLVKKVPDAIPNILIGSSNGVSSVISSEPCFGTHVGCTGDIGKFLVLSCKSKSNKEKVIRAATGSWAEKVEKDGYIYSEQIAKLQEYVLSCLSKEKLDYMELWDCLKEVKIAKEYHEKELPMVLFRRNQDILSSLSRKLTEATKEFVQLGFKLVSSELQQVLHEHSSKSFIVHKLQAIGDGKKIVNYALENSGNKPAMYFVQDGYKNIICSCQVPKHLISPKFSALLWINPVASRLEGRARSLPADSRLLYSVVCSKTDDIPKAIELAEHFAETHLKSDNASS